MLYVLQQLEPQQFYSDNLLQDYKKGDKDLVVPVCVRVHGYFSLACYFTHTGVFTNYAVSRRGMYCTQQEQPIEKVGTKDDISLNFKKAIRRAVKNSPNVLYGHRRCSRSVTFYTDPDPGSEEKSFTDPDADRALILVQAKMHSVSGRY